MKKAVTMQDISCIGKCSLTVAMPTLSAMGIETAVLPTAILSTHTMFSHFSFHDLTNEIEPIMSHWKKEGFTFDAVYTGYLGSIKQIDLAHQLFHTFGKGLKIVDPCMADSGKLYTGFTDEFVEEMKKLCKEADIICPNITEACLLLNRPYLENYTEEDIKGILKELTDLGCSKAVITGVSFNNEQLGAYAYDRQLNQYDCYFTTKEKQSFHGTGDLWAATLCGALVLNKTFLEAITLACNYVQLAIHLTIQEENHNTYGVNFEQAIPYLIQNL